jgi:hypothetical protein
MFPQVLRPGTELDASHVRVHFAVVWSPTTATDEFQHSMLVSHMNDGRKTANIYANNNVADAEQT